MIDIFPYERRPSYPHMKPYDTEIWDSFVFQFPDEYTNCQYDLAVGPGAPVDPVVNVATGGDIYELYQRKIDVVGRKGSRTDIIEVKPGAGPAAVGQVKFYKKLYLEDFKPSGVVRPVIVTDQAKPGMKEYCENEGVALVEVGK
jgi:hypothetical protein